MVLVVGATGQLGGRIARELLSKGTQVRALCRPGSGYGALQRMGAEIVMGDLKDPASLAAACAGVQTVITTANTARRGGDDTVESVDLNGTRNLIDAARAAGVRHFVYLSVYGAAASSPVPFLAAKGKNDDYLKASGMEWTIVAPNAFMEAWPGMVVGGPAAAGQPVILVGEGRRRHAFVAEHDVAQFAVAAVLNPAARNRHLAIGGPQAVTWRDVVATYEQVLGKPIEVRYVKPGDHVEGMPDVLLQLLTMYDSFDTDFDTTALANEFSVQQTPLEAWVRASTAVTRRTI
jgi:NADH dehydrogenase